MSKRQLKLPERIRNSRITKVKLRSDIINGKRCHLCCTKFVENKQKDKNSSKRVFNVKISNSTFGLFLASQILSVNKDIFDNESEENHRFRVNSDFKVCRKCGITTKKLFALNKLTLKRPYSSWPNLDPNPSDYFSHAEVEPRNSNAKYLKSDSVSLKILKEVDVDVLDEDFSHGENHDESEKNEDLENSEDS